MMNAVLRGTALSFAVTTSTACAARTVTSLQTHRQVGFIPAWTRCWRWCSAGARGLGPLSLWQRALHHFSPSWRACKGRGRVGSGTPPCPRPQERVHTKQSPARAAAPSLVERELSVALLDVGPVALLKVLGQDDVPASCHAASHSPRQTPRLLQHSKWRRTGPGGHAGENAPVLAHGVHARLLADGGDLGGADLVGPAHVVLQIHLVAQVHLAGAHLQGDARAPSNSSTRPRACARQPATRGTSADAPGARRRWPRSRGCTRLGWCGCGTDASVPAQGAAEWGPPARAGWIGRGEGGGGGIAPGRRGASAAGRAWGTQSCGRGGPGAAARGPRCRRGWWP